MKRILCVGNRFVAGDSLGPRVYEAIVRRPLPDGVEVVDAGLSGLDLLPLIESCERVVFVDQMDGCDPTALVVMTAAEIAATAPDRFDHGSGIAFLVRILPEVCEGVVPEVLAIGSCAEPSPPVIERLADAALHLALHGPQAVSTRGVA